MAMEKMSDRIMTALKEIQQDYAHLAEQRNYDDLLSKIFRLSNEILEEKRDAQKDFHPGRGSGQLQPVDTVIKKTDTWDPGENPSEIHDIGTQIRESIHLIEQRTVKKIPSAYIPTGFDLLDRRIGGWEPGELIVIGSRPSMGKTCLGLSLMRNVAVLHDIPCAYFTFETGVQHLTERIMAAESEIEMAKLKKGKLSEQEWTRLDKGLRIILEKPISLVSDPLMYPDRLHSTLHRLASEKKVRLVVLDYLQLILPHRIRRNREQEVSTLLRSIKSIAKELNIVVLLLSQLNRSVELRAGNKRPMLSDLRESGAIEDDADKVIFLHRPEYYGIIEDENGNSLQGMAELIIAKNRTGTTDELVLRFNSKYGKFSQLDIILEALGDIRPEDVLDGDSPF
jgi:replicative DNA helicase